MRNQGSDLLKGALLGGILGGAAALLLAPKSGEELREDIEGGYETLRDKAQRLTENLKETGHKCLHPFEVDEDHNSPFVIGGVVGAVIGAIAALLLAPQSGSELREALGDKYDEIREKAEDFTSNLDSRRRNAVDQVGEWKDALVTIIDRLSGQKGKKKFHLNEIFDWAIIGLNLLQKVQKRR